MRIIISEDISELISHANFGARIILEILGVYTAFQMICVLYTLSLKILYWVN